MFEEAAIAPLALAQRRLDLLALGEVANDHARALGAGVVRVDLGQDLSEKGRAVPPQEPQFASRASGPLPLFEADGEPGVSDIDEVGSCRALQLLL